MRGAVRVEGDGSLRRVQAGGGGRRGTRQGRPREGHGEAHKAALRRRRGEELPPVHAEDGEHAVQESREEGQVERSLVLRFLLHELLREVLQLPLPGKDVRKVPAVSEHVRVSQVHARATVQRGRVQELSRRGRGDDESARRAGPGPRRAAPRRGRRAAQGGEIGARGVAVGRPGDTGDAPGGDVQARVRPVQRVHRGLPSPLRELRERLLPRLRRGDARAAALPRQVGVSPGDATVGGRREVLRAGGEDRGRRRARRGGRGRARSRGAVEADARGEDGAEEGDEGEVPKVHSRRGRRTDQRDLDAGRVRGAHASGARKPGVELRGRGQHQREPESCDRGGRERAGEEARRHRDAAVVESALRQRLHQGVARRRQGVHGPAR
mmetsp:Transcript_8586/g.31440  ORF Transcript_8586/g.31440 Transcript_8586/m.31440 type:complete len:382 (-) Transcript_8586:365-1510(-)